MQPTKNKAIRDLAACLGIAINTALGYWALSPFGWPTHSRVIVGWGFAVLLAALHALKPRQEQSIAAD